MQRKLFARLALLGFLGFCLTWLARLDYAQKISTNVVDLIPAAEQAPEIGLIRSFASDVQARVMLFALHDPVAPGVPPDDAAAAFAASLARSPEFAEAVVVGDAGARETLGRGLVEHRFELLLPTWLGEREREFTSTGQRPENFSAWLARRAAADLEAFLAKPEAGAVQELLPRDPLLLVPALVEHASALAPPAGRAGQALVWARIAASPFAEEGQAPVFAAVEGALAAARKARPGLELRWTGVNRFAAASRARIEAEIGLLNTLSLVAVLGVTCVFVRRIHKVLHLVPVIALALLGAWTVSTMVFARLHILVFVIGSLLAGVAIDYGFYIYMQPPRNADESYGEKLRRLLKPLLASCLTTVIGFSLLLFSELPLIRQIGLFVSAGLICALGAAMLYFAQLERPLLEGRTFDVLGGSRARAVRWLPPVLLAAAVIAAVVGPWRLRWRDDIRELDLPSTALRANEESVRALFGDTAGRSMYLTYGGSVGEARERLDAFLAHEKAAGENATSVGRLLPTEGDWRELSARLARLEFFASDFRAALEARGFTADAFAPFFEAWDAWRATPALGGYADVVTDFRRLFTGPLALLSNTRDAPCWFLTVVERPAGTPPPPGLNTLGLNQLESLNDLFRRYRGSALRLSLAGLGLVIGSVFAIYPGRRAVRIALIPAGSCLVVFGAFGLAGQTLNLFHLLGAFLGVCLSHNYAIFSADNAAAGAAPPIPIRLSALSTAASFGVLGFSRIPVVHALGMTVALIVLTALASVELEPLARRARA